MDSGASRHYFDDVIIRDLKHRPQDYVHLTTPRKIFTAGGAMVDGTVEGVLLGLVADDNGNRIFSSGRYRIGARDWAQPVLGDDSNQKGRCHYLPLRKSQAGGIQSHRAATERERRPLLVRTGLKCGPIWRLGHLHAQSLDILRKRDGTGITFGGAASDCAVCAVGKAQQLAHPKTANNRVNRPFQLCYRNLIGP